MAKSKSKKSAQRVLLADEDVIVRMAIAEYLRDCGLTVLEAATSQEAKAILQAGPEIDVLFSDAQLAGRESGFALAQWVRRNRPSMQIVLEVSVDAKAASAFELCCPPERHKKFDSQALAAKIQAMIAERRRRTRPQQSSAMPLRRRRS